MFVAPALLASAAITVASEEFTYPIMLGYKWNPTFTGMSASPLRPTQIVDGIVISVAVRMAVNLVLFFALILVFGAAPSPIAFLMIPAGLLGGLAFGAVLMGYTSTLEEDTGQLAMVMRFVVLPMTLFSGTFFPLSSFPVCAAVDRLDLAALAQHRAGARVLLRVRRADLAHRRARRVPRGPRGDRMGLGPAHRRAEARAMTGVTQRDLVPPGGATPADAIALRRQRPLGHAARLARDAQHELARHRERVLRADLLPAGDGHRPRPARRHRRRPRAGRQVPYAAFIAPALLAVSAMNGAIYDSTWNVFFKMQFAKLYEGMLSTSLGPLDVALGEILLALLRGALYAIGFQLVMQVLGLNLSWWALLALPAVLLIAFGFASVGMAITSYMKSFQQMDWINFVMLPMFLFSATFYPITVYPEWFQHVIQALPLWHGVELVRGLTTGDVSWGMLWHVLYYVVMIGGRPGVHDQAAARALPGLSSSTRLARPTGGRAARPPPTGRAVGLLTRSDDRRRPYSSCAYPIAPAIMPRPRLTVRSPRARSAANPRGRRSPIARPRRGLAPHRARVRAIARRTCGSPWARARSAPVPTCCRSGRCASAPTTA